MATDVGMKRFMSKYAERIPHCRSRATNFLFTLVWIVTILYRHCVSTPVLEQAEAKVQGNRRHWNSIGHVGFWSVLMLLYWTETCHEGKQTRSNRRWQKYKTPVILSVIHHHQNPLDSTYILKSTQQNECRHVKTKTVITASFQVWQSCNNWIRN
jgi:hypothetical protein